MENSISRNLLTINLVIYCAGAVTGYSEAGLCYLQFLETLSQSKID